MFRRTHADNASNVFGVKTRNRLGTLFFLQSDDGTLRKGQSEVQIYKKVAAETRKESSRKENVTRPPVRGFTEVANAEDEQMQEGRTLAGRPNRLRSIVFFRDEAAERTTPMESESMDTPRFLDENESSSETDRGRRRIPIRIGPEHPEVGFSPTMKQKLKNA